VCVSSSSSIQVKKRLLLDWEIPSSTLFRVGPMAAVGC